MSSASTSTIPVCTSCAPTNTCCVFNSNVCVPTSVREVKTTDELLDTDPFAQILDVMCAAGYLFGPCCCRPIGDSNIGYTLDELLVVLQARFPDANWNIDDLTSFMTDGISQGLFRRWTRETDDGTQLTTYFANQNLLNVNPKNWIYADICPRLCAKKTCRAPSSLGGTFC